MAVSSCPSAGVRRPLNVGPLVGLMTSQRSNVALAVIAAYPLAAWAFTGCLVAVISSRGGADMGWWTVFAAAPVMVPLLTLQSPDVFMLVSSRGELCDPRDLGVERVSYAEVPRS